MKRKRRKINKMKIRLLLFVYLIFLETAFSQHALLPKAGSIRFERRINAYALLNQAYPSDSHFAQAYKQKFPQFKQSEFILFFTENQTSYRPTETENTNYFNFLDRTAFSNFVFSDLSRQRYIARKKIYGEEFLIQDVSRKVHWKLTGETREIAGFHCHRADAVIMDSIYVVAFYTDEIPVSGGPESFNGLPGMILGIAIPFIHTTWYANSVLFKNPEEEELLPPKGKVALSNNQLKEKLSPQFHNNEPSSLRSWIFLFL